MFVLTLSLTLTYLHSTVLFIWKHARDRFFILNLVRIKIFQVWASPAHGWLELPNCLH